MFHIPAHKSTTAGQVEITGPASPDFDLVNHGSISVLTPLNQAAKDWCLDHLPGDSQLWGKDGIVIEHRFVSDILQGLGDDGFKL